MKYELITEKNLDLAVKVQNEIFPEENGKQNFIDSINKDQYRKELTYYLVFDNETPVGVSGLYSYHEYPNDAWLGWYGVLKEFRGKGYGSKIFDHFEKISKEKGYKNIRLYTDINMYKDAIKLYYKKGMISEKYENDNEDESIRNTTLIFSKSLTEKETKLWNNKNLELNNQVKKEKNSNN